MFMQAISEYADGLFDAAITGSSTDVFVPPMLIDLYQIFALPRELAAYRAALNGARKASVDGLGSAMAYAKQIEQQAPRGYLASMCLPVLRVTCGNLAKADAIHAVMIAAITAQETRARTGAWPVAAEASWPMDPCTGKPLLTAVDGDRLRIWSFDSDLTDENGAEFDKKTKKGDIALTIGPP